MRRTRRTGLPCPLDVLPAELMTDILEYLTPDELWRAARVSRQFYAAAWRAGLFIHRNIVWTDPLSLSPDLPQFKAVLEHAKRRNLRLSLCLWCFFLSQRYTSLQKEFYDEFQSGVDELFPLLSEALPFLDYLSLRIPDHFRPQLDSALLFPAPRLRTFELFRTTSNAVSPNPLPHDLFGGSAPLLRTFRMGTPALPSIPVPALRSVTHVVLTYFDSFPALRLGLLFPHLTSLHLRFLVTSDGGDVSLPDSLDFSGLALRGLVIDDDNKRVDRAPLLGVVERSVELSAIPTVEIVSAAIVWTDKIWSKDCTELLVRATFIARERDELRVHVLLAHTRWRRLYGVSWWETGLPLPVGELPDIGARMTYLRIDAPLVRGFLALQRPFHELRDLHIDVGTVHWELESLAPQDYTAESELQQARVWAPCAALEELTLFAVDGPITDADWRAVAFLAHALGQRHRQPKADRAALALVGFAFAKPVAHALLAQTVSRIRRYAFAGGGSPEDYDEGLWECELFDRD